MRIFEVFKYCYNKQYTLFFKCYALVTRFFIYSFTFVIMYDVAYLMKGKLKKRILALLDNPKTATMLGKEIKRHRSSISRILLELEKRKLVSCKNPDDNMYRFYQITKKGKNLIEKMKEFG